MLTATTEVSARVIVVSGAASGSIADPSRSIYANPVVPGAELRWSPTIGDPSVMGWVTVAAYFVTAWLCLRAFMAEKSGPRRPYLASIAALWRVTKKHRLGLPPVARHAVLWLVLAAAMTFLGINKQLDLQTLVTELGRVSAHRHGWYEERRTVQTIFIAVIGGLGLLSVALLVWLIRDSLRRFIVALFGVIWLGTFVLIRASSFHRVDILLKTEIAGVKLNWAFELTGIAIVAIAAVRAIRAGQARE